MKISVIKIVANILRDIANKLDAGNSELTEEEAMDLMSVLSHHVLSKNSACKYLNISRSKFDTMIKEKKLPKGRKRVGFKELVWYKDEIDNCINKQNK